MAESKLYLAHVKQATDGKWLEHDLQDHLREVGKLAAEMASGFNSESWAKVTGLWHDLGKYRSAFQTVMANVTETVAQETANAENWLPTPCRSPRFALNL